MCVKLLEQSFILKNRINNWRKNHPKWVNLLNQNHSWPTQKRTKGARDILRADGMFGARPTRLCPDQSSQVSNEPKTFWHKTDSEGSNEHLVTKS
jgi:hypothetical protein